MFSKKEKDDMVQKEKNEMIDKLNEAIIQAGKTNGSRKVIQSNIIFVRDKLMK